MRLLELYLENYRNYTSKKFNFENDFVVIYGNNGVGKTNILEAISYLTAGNGLKKAKLSEISNVCSDKNYFKVNSIMNIAQIFYTINCIYDTEQSPFRNILIDDKKTSQKDLQNISKIFWITPAMDKVFLEGPISSRKLIDKLTAIFYPNHANELSDINKLFKQRNFFIKNGIKKDSLLNSIDHQISNLSVSIASSRHLFISKLNKVMQESPTSFPKISISLSGFIENRIQENTPFTLIEEEYQSYLKEKRLMDELIESINKTKILIYNEDLKMPSHMTSTGQQKIILFSLILSCCYMIKEIKGYTPLLLLDEVVAHLDEEHKKKLFTELENLGIQTFLTGVFKEDFKLLEKKKSYFIQIQ